MMEHVRTRSKQLMNLFKTLRKYFAFQIYFFLSAAQYNRTTLARIVLRPTFPWFIQ
uniref:Uncharacterized protein n=1 Tax=Arundo donax TaxID=35708 RepID=A0A0A9B5U9_ARUDO